MKVSEYIRQATRADMGNTYVVPYPYLLKEVAQLLVGYKASIKNMQRKTRRIGWG